MPSDTYPVKWHYPTEDGHITKEQYREFWEWSSGKGNYVFWRFLPAYPGAREFLRQANQVFSEIHFVTSRPGKDVKEATVDALAMLGIPSPSVHVADYKPPVLKDLGATDFLDDRDKNFMEAIEYGLNEDNGASPVEHFILDRPWNRHFNHVWVSRVKDPMEIL